MTNEEENKSANQGKEGDRDRRDQTTGEKRRGDRGPAKPSDVTLKLERPEQWPPPPDSEKENK